MTTTTTNAPQPKSGIQKYSSLIQVTLFLICVIIFIVWAVHDYKKAGLTQDEKNKRKKIQETLLPIWIIFGVLWLASLWKFGVGSPGR